MGGLSSLTNALTRASDGKSHGLFHLNIPSTSLGGLMPITKETEITSLGELAASVSDTLGNLNQIAHMAYCLGEMITNPEMLLHVLDNITNNLAAVAFDMAEKLASVVEGQILGAFGTVVGTALNLANSILDFLTSVLQVYESLLNIWDNIKNRARGNWNDFMSQEQCEFMLASIASCLLNKLYGDKLEKFERKVTSKITETGQSINKALSNELADVNSLGNYIRHESFMMNKANQQLQLFA